MTKEEKEIVFNKISDIGRGVAAKAVCFAHLDHETEYVQIFWHTDKRSAHIGMPYAMLIDKDTNVLIKQIQFDLIKDGFEVLHDLR